MDDQYIITTIDLFNKYYLNKAPLTIIIYFIKL